MTPGTATPHAERPVPYVLSWRLEAQKVVVVGGGNIGTAKVELLLGTKAKILVVDPTPSDRVRDLASRNTIQLKLRRARPTDLLGARLLVAATGCSKTNRRLRLFARPLGIVVNAVDDPPNCDVTVPAIIRRGGVTVAITTDGSSPAGARFLREELTAAVDQAMPKDLGVVFAQAAQARQALRSTGRYCYDYRAWRERFFEPAMAVPATGSAHDRFQWIERLRHQFVESFGSNHDQRVGRVTLVGAGPGGKDLITVRGAKVLSAADVVIYDRLADSALLELAPPAAERIPVGKAKASGQSQTDINDLLIEHALRGDHVVRLKGGDSFVFGRGREEIDAVEARGIEVEVVPGVSSAIAGPELAGIPLTDRRYAASFTVITGHRAASDGCQVGERLNDSKRWRALADSGDTVVVLMAASTSSEVAARLSEAGRPSDEPVAFVYAAATPNQRVSVATLADVVTEGCPFPAPAIMIVGQVAKYANKTSSDRTRPAKPEVAVAN